VGFVEVGRGKEKGVGEVQQYASRAMRAKSEGRRGDFGATAQQSRSPPTQHNHPLSHPTHRPSTPSTPPPAHPS